MTQSNNPRCDDDDEPKQPTPPMMVPKKKPYQHFEQTFQACHIHFYLSEEIGEPADYVEMIHRIRNATPADIVFVHLNTPGGRIDTGVQLINAMKSSAAKVVTVLESTAYSLGTLIFLAGDEMVVHDNCMMMFHNFRSGVTGKGNEQAVQISAQIRWFGQLAERTYVPFLTKDELKRVLRGEDLWMQSAEIRKRLERATKQHHAKKPGRKPGRKGKKKVEQPESVE